MDSVLADTLKANLKNAATEEAKLDALEIMNAVEAGTREPPTMAEFKAGLPVIGWSAE